MLRSKLNQTLFVRRLKARAFSSSAKHLSSHRWYGTYRDLEIERQLSTPFDGSQLPPGFGQWVDERIVEYPWFFAGLPPGPGSLLDAGSTLNHAHILKHPQLQQKKITIMTLAPEVQSFWTQGISYVYGDLRRTFFRDACFDTVVSLSVIEHIGLDNRIYDSNHSGTEANSKGYIAAVGEFHRILRPGGTCLISVPYGARSVRNWLQVFDAEMIDSVINTFSPASYDETYFLYSRSSGWQRSTRSESSQARYFDLRTDTPWPGCPAAAGAVACLRLVK